MVTLSGAHDYVVLFAIAALFGAVGGLAYELLQTRAKETGSIELPWARGWRYIHLGVISNLLLGAVAAVAISYFFTPELQVKETVNGVTTVVTKWQIVKVVPLSLIVGSAGGAFLEAMKSRLLGELNAQKIVATQAAARAGATQVALAGKATHLALAGAPLNERATLGATNAIDASLAAALASIDAAATGTPG
jgi:hypothetical protein